MVQLARQMLPVTGIVMEPLQSAHHPEAPGITNTQKTGVPIGSIPVTLQASLLEIMLFKSETKIILPAYMI